MSTDKKSEEFYKKLRQQLIETETWPAEYLYKFIVHVLVVGVIHQKIPLKFQNWQQNLDIGLY